MDFPSVRSAIWTDNRSHLQSVYRGRAFFCFLLLPPPPSTPLLPESGCHHAIPVLRVSRACYTSLVDLSPTRYLPSPVSFPLSFYSCHFVQLLPCFLLQLLLLLLLAFSFIATTYSMCLLFQPSFCLLLLLLLLLLLRLLHHLLLDFRFVFIAFFFVFLLAFSCLLSSSLCRLFSSSPVPAGSPSSGGDVVVDVEDVNQPSLTTPFYSVLVFISVFKTLSTVFHSLNSPDNSHLSHSVLPVLILPCYWSFQYISLYASLPQP